MLAFIVTLRCGRRYTVRAEELRYTDGGGLELWGFPPATEAEPYPAKRIIALFNAHEVIAVVAKEHLVAEERGEPIAPPLVVGHGNDPIPF